MMDIFNEVVVAVLIVWISMAIPSIAYGVVKARRAGKSPGLAIIVSLLLPWLGLAFITSRRRGKTRVVGLGYYCAWMLLVAAVMAVISIFLPWITGDPQLLGEERYAPKDVLVLAILIAVWAISLVAGAIGINRGGDLGAGISLGVSVSLMGGILIALNYLWGSAGVFVPGLRDMQDQLEDKVQIGPGGWVAIVALAVAYICVTLLPFGLRFDPEPEQPQMEQGQGQQWPEHGPHGPHGQPQFQPEFQGQPPFGHGQPPQGQPQPGHPPAQPWSQGGAGW